MADAVSNLLLRIRGESSDGEEKLDSFYGRLKAFGQTKATAEADVNVNVSKIAEAAAALAAFGQTKATAEADVKVTGVEKVAGIMAAIDAVAAAQSPEVQVKIAADSVGAAKVVEEISAIEAAANAVKATVHVDADTGTTLADLAAIKAAADLLDHDKVNVKVDTDTTASSKLEALAGIGEKITNVLGGAFTNTQQAASKFSDAISGTTVNVGAFGLKLGPVVVLLISAAVAMGVALVAAASLLAVAIAGAVAALGALAVALAGVLGPAVVLAIGVFQKFTQVLKVVKDQQTAHDAASRKSADGTLAAAKAAEIRTQKLQAVASAVRGLVTAERGLSTAQDNARQGIVDANRAEADAAQNLQDANQRVAQATVDGFRAMRDAVEGVKDAYLQLEQAQLGIRSADLATRQAELNLKQFREEAGLAGQSFDALFKKFTNVDFRGNVKGLLSAAGGDAGGASGELKLEGLILAVQQAKLGEKSASDSLHDSTVNLADARQKEAEFAAKGLAAFGPYTDAIKQQHAATRNLADATAHANQVNAEGVKNNAQVLAAQDALVGATQRLADARRQLKVKETGGIADDAAKARQEYDKLSPALQRFVDQFLKAKEQLKGFFQPAVDAVFKGFGDVAQGLPSLLNPLRGDFAGLGRSVGGVFSGLGKSLGDPKTVAAIRELIRGAAELVKIFGSSIFPAFVALFLRLATLALPKLIDLTKSFGNTLSGLGKADGGGLGKFLDTVFGQLDAVWGLIKAVAGVFAAFFTDTAGQSVGFVQFLTDAANGLKGFLESKDGQEAIRKFFKDVIPVAKESLKFIGLVILTILQVVQVVAPAITGLLSVINFLLGAFNRILSFFKPFLQALGIVALFLGSPGSGIVKAILFLGRRLAGLAAVFPGFFNKFKTAILDIISFVSKTFGRILHYLELPFRAFGGFLERFLGGVFDIGKKIVEQLAKGIASVPGKVVNAAKHALGKLGDLLPGSEPKDPTSPLRGLGKRGAAILGNVSEGVSAGADRLASAVHRGLNPVVTQVSTAVNVPAAKVDGGSLAASFGKAGTHIDNVNLPPAPAGAIPDARYQAEQFAREVTRRAG